MEAKLKLKKKSLLLLRYLLFAVLNALVLATSGSGTHARFNTCDPKVTLSLLIVHERSRPRLLHILTFNFPDIFIFPP